MEQTLSKPPAVSMTALLRPAGAFSASSAICLPLYKGRKTGGTALPIIFTGRFAARKAGVARFRPPPIKKSAKEAIADRGQMKKNTH